MFTSSYMSELHIHKKISPNHTPDYLCTKFICCYTDEIETLIKLIRLNFMKTTPVIGYIKFIFYFCISIHTIYYGVYSCRKNPPNQDNKQLRSWVVTASLK